MLPSAGRPPVTDLMVYLTEECNLRCSYCFVHKKPRHMSRETVLKALRFLLSPEISGDAERVSFTFFGGEPFLQLGLMEAVWEEWQALSSQYPGKRLRLAATTNGTLFSRRIEEFVRKTAMSLLISIDGDAKSNAERPFVSGRASYSVVRKNLPRFVASAKCVTARVTFHPQSLDLLGSVRHALELGAPAVILAPVVEAEWGGLEHEVRARYLELADWMISELRNGRVPPLVLTWEALQAWNDRGPEGRPPRPCPVGHSLLAIDPDGNVMPCHRFLYRPQHWLGRVDSVELSERRQQFAELTSLDIDNDCARCPARSICGGGCRVVSLQSGGGLYGTHPFHCLLTRAHALAVERIDQFLSDEADLLSHFFPPAEPELPAALLESVY